MVWRNRLPTKPIRLLTIINKSTLDHDGIQPSYNHGQKGCHIYGQALRASVLLADAKIGEGLAAFI